MVDIKDIPAGEIAAKLTMSTAEIDGIEEMNPFLKTVISAKILKVAQHPNADKLTIVDLDTGAEKLRVVCGAPNHREGDIVPLAKVGTRLTEECTVKKTKIRGEESSGMLCSEKELGLSDDHSGIMILPSDTPLGKPLSELYPDWIDTRLEIDNKSITHRPDLWCHAGFAREIAALFERSYKSPVDTSLADGFADKETLKVVIENPDASPRYCGLCVKNIRIEESPEWLKARVTAIGMRPINNIVDITNYVMCEIGEPMHAFDRRKLNGDTIFVRMARKDEKLKTLDEQEHDLLQEDIVIADQKEAIALAGVMGGGGSEIDDNTSEIVLEAANFNPVNIRKTANRFNLRTEAAIRFEKSLDPELCTSAIIRCYDLIKQLIPEAEAVTRIVDTYPVKSPSVEIRTTTDFIRKKLGYDLPDGRIQSILTSLGFLIDKRDNHLDITVPTYRATKDVSIPDDIVEEVGRIFGYDNIPETPPFVPCTPPVINTRRSFERRVKEILVRDCCSIEVSSYSFVGEDLLNSLEINEDKELRLKNPLSREQDRLRRSLLPNLLKAVEFNARFQEEFHIFELGRVYFKKERNSDELASESTRISGAFYQRDAATPLFYSSKQTVLNLLSQLEVDSFTLQPETVKLPPYAHPGRSVVLKIRGSQAGMIFEVHPRIMKKLDIKGTAAIYDMDMDVLLNADKRAKGFSELPRFPDVPFEVSVLADKQSYAGALMDIIIKTSPLVKSVEVISLYEGKPIPEDKKSVSLKIIFSSREKTLSTEEIDKLQKNVVAELSKYGFGLR